MKKIKFMLTAFRDGFQSVYGARVFSKDYLPVVEFAAKECGIRHLEAGGGAMFQSPYFYSRENAFDVMDAFRTAAGPDADLQTLARGISVVALKAQPRDIIKLHADMFKKHVESGARLTIAGTIVDRATANDLGIKKIKNAELRRLTRAITPL